MKGDPPHFPRGPLGAENEPRDSGVAPTPAPPSAGSAHRPVPPSSVGTSPWAPQWGQRVSPRSVGRTWAPAAGGGGAGCRTGLLWVRGGARAVTPQPQLLGPAPHPTPCQGASSPDRGPRVSRESDRRGACLPLGWVFSVLGLIKPPAFPRRSATCLRLGCMLQLSRLPSEFSSLVTLCSEAAGAAGAAWTLVSVEMALCSFTRPLRFARPGLHGARRRV